ncbi:primosomal protein N' [Yunchengibacter salinarum]|uniref:primosomal protein N' n=1 Tax=Yunchengibacter salinarum TaxID=3133399 RepID=UPI0035B59274
MADLFASAPGAPPATVPVLLPLPLAGPLDYACDRALPPGTVVRVTLSGRRAVGVVWDRQADGPQVPPDRLKPVESVLDTPGITPDLRQLVDFVAAYTLALPGLVLRMVLSVPEALEAPPMRRHYRAISPMPTGARLTEARRKAHTALMTAGPQTATDLATLAGVSAAVVRGLVDAGLATVEDRSQDAPFAPPDPDRQGPTLSHEQREAATRLCDAVAAANFAPFLLDGVTGSGKTEVYFQAVASALADGRQALVLVPEIALTSQWLDRFQARFGVEPVVWHSNQGKAARRRGWRAVARGEAPVVVGARSALFLPFHDLGVIVVDEEHDPSFKQEDGVLYHARDMAVMRAKYAACPVVLASATPSLESRINAAAGRYGLLELKERHGGAALPRMEAVDMRHDGPPAGQWLAPALARRMQATLEAGQQSMLFLNRRGYAPLTLCRDCGHRFQCGQCTAWLVEHRFRRELHCHHCGHREPVPETCPACGAAETLVACGPGVERIEEEVRQRFPQARVAVMTSDTMTGPDETARLVARIAEGGVDIIIGTQIVTKGYHFPGLTLVGVVDADLGLRGGDLRAGERTYQQLVQVAGRAGRADRPGRVMLQSYEPNHPVVAALLAGDGDAFMALEEDARARLNMPPFGKLVALILSGSDENAVAALGRALAAAAPQQPGVAVFGPSPAPLARLRGHYRYRLLMHAHKGVPVQKLVRGWLKGQGHKGVRIRVDVDPLSFL